MLIRVLVFFFLIAMNFALQATDANFQDWHYTAADDVASGQTASETGANFGVLCTRSKNSCFFYFDSSTSCNDGHSIVFLANTDQGSESFTGVCHILTTPQGPIRAVLISETNDVLTLIKSSSTIGLAFPLEAGQFKVFRFSLSGFSQALTAVTNYANKKTGDQIL